MSLVVVWDRKFALTLAITVFFIIWTKLFNSWSLFYSLAKIDSHRLFLKYLSIVSLAGALTGLYTNKINCKYLKYATHSSTNFCWYRETRLNWLRILLAKSQSSPRIFRKKSLNSSYVIRSLTLKQRFC